MHWSEHADSQFGIRLNARQLEAFDWYAAELQAWNERFNLTSVTDLNQIEIKHFLDSLSCLTAMHTCLTETVEAFTLVFLVVVPRLALRLLTPALLSLRRTLLSGVLRIDLLKLLAVFGVLNFHRDSVAKIGRVGL